MESTEAMPRDEDVPQRAERELRPLQGGRRIRFLGEELPVRAIAAIGVFVFAFMVVWLLLWAVLGGIGLGLGWIPAALAGAWAGREYARRSAATPARGQSMDGGASVRGTDATATVERREP